jgi:hypothetical protein
MSEKRVRLVMTTDEYLESSEENNGVCLACGEIQFGGCEPDARNYLCESCGEHKVFGIEEALMMGRITIDEGDEDGDE